MKKIKKSITEIEMTEDYGIGPRWTVDLGGKPSQSALVIYKRVNGTNTILGTYPYRPGKFKLWNRIRVWWIMNVIIRK